MGPNQPTLGSIGDDPQNLFLGTLTEHIHPLTVRPQYRRHDHGSVTVPVSAIFAPFIGTLTERLYTTPYGYSLSLVDSRAGPGIHKARQSE